jgi:hypothetical protein
MGFLLGVVHDARPRPRMSANEAGVDGLSESTGVLAAAVQPVLLDRALSLDQSRESAELASMEEGVVSGSREVAELPAPGLGRPREQVEESAGGKPARRQWLQGTEAAKQTSIRKGTAVAVKYSVGVPTDAMNVEADSKLVGLSAGSAAPPSPLDNASGPSLGDSFAQGAEPTATIVARDPTGTSHGAESAYEPQEASVGAASPPTRGAARIVGWTTATSSAPPPPAQDDAGRSEHGHAAAEVGAGAARTVSTTEDKSSTTKSRTIRDPAEPNRPVVDARRQSTPSAARERAPRASSADQPRADRSTPASSNSPGLRRDAIPREGRPAALRAATPDRTVHIGHVEIVVMPPVTPAARAAPTPARPSSLASRLYLRNF